MADQRAELRARQRQYTLDDAVQALLRRDAESAGKLVTLPVATTSHATTMTDSVAERPAEAPSAVALSAVETLKPRTRAPEPGERIASTDAVLADHAAGRPVDPDELRAARLFAQSPEYRADKMLRLPIPSRGQPAVPSLPKEYRA